MMIANKRTTAAFAALFLSTMLFIFAAGAFAADKASRKILIRYGYAGDTGLLAFYDYASIFLCAVVFSLLLTLAAYALWARHKKRMEKRVANLTAYLREMNAGEYRLRPAVKEDELSPLEDELYKTVVLLREGREAAGAEKERLARNLSDIAHQLKTPLSSIALMSDLLTAEAGGKQAEYAERIIAQTERLSALVSSLLALSRMDAGTLTLERNPVDVREMLISAAEPLLPIIEKKAQTLCFPGHDAAYIGDLYWSSQAFANLLKNCCDYTSEGGNIFVSWEDNPICTVIVIEDDGTGIPAEDLPYLFNRFYRGKNADRDSIGIGLPFAKAVIEKQNGEIRVENRREGGARFTVKFYHGV